MEKEHTYWALNSAKTTDDHLTAMVEKIVNGLFSVVATMGVLPIIRCGRNSAAEMIATRLDRRLRFVALSLVLLATSLLNLVSTLGTFTSVKKTKTTSSEAGQHLHQRRDLSWYCVGEMSTLFPCLLTRGLTKAFSTTY